VKEIYYSSKKIKILSNRPLFDGTEEPGIFLDPKLEGMLEIFPSPGTCIENERLEFFLVPKPG